MSILIKDMEMPKNCALCKLRGAGETWCPFTLREVPGNTIPEDCPLVPVPPHGDLIDRDALIKDGWLNLHKEVIRIGGYAIHELPLKNPSIPVIIPADPAEEG